MSNYKETVAIIGLGYVGLPLAIAFVKKGYKVFGIDINEKRIEVLRNGKSFISDISDDEIVRLIDSKIFEATTDYSVLDKTDHIIICVPTPLRNKEPDLSYVYSTINQMAPYLQPGQLVVLESSTYPGTTEDIIKPLLEDHGFTIGTNLFLGYSPERIDPGNMQYILEQIPKIVSGVTDYCLERISRLYSDVFQTIVPVTTPRIAEFVKIIENSQRLINISFINEVNMLANLLQINIWEVIQTAATKPFGFTPFYPSPGVGGHCIPVDPFYLTWIGMQEGFPLTMIQQAGIVNEMMPHFIVKRITQILSGKGVSAQQANIGVIGVTYKKDVNDIRESASMKVIELLLNKKMKVSVHEPIYKGNAPFDLPVFDIEPLMLQALDAIVVLVDHSCINWSDVVSHSRCVIDTRNVTASYKGDHIVRI